MHVPTSSQLRKAAKIREKIEALEAELNAILSGTATPKKKAGRRKRRNLSAEARARISAAQKKRWAKQKKKARN